MTAFRFLEPAEEEMNQAGSFYEPLPKASALISSPTFSLPSIEFANILL